MPYGVAGFLYVTSCTEKQAGDTALSMISAVERYLTIFMGDFWHAKRITTKLVATRAVFANRGYTRESSAT